MKPLSERSQFHRPRAPLKQADAKMRLKLRDMAAHTRFGHAQSLSRRADPAKPGDRAETAKSWQSNRSNIVNHRFKLIPLF